MLFKNVNKLVEYAQLTLDTTAWASAMPTIKLVEDKHLVPILGKEQYAALNAAYTGAANEDALSAAEKDLLEQCRKVIGPYVCYYYAPKADVSLSDAGVRRAETEQKKTAFQYQVTNFREANLQEAESAAENLIQFLEDNIASYSLWKDSDAFKAYRGLFIKTATEFGELFTTHSPYRNFWAMRPKMIDVEELSIRPFLGSTLYDALKLKDATAVTGFTDKEKALLLRLKKAIAAFTVAYAIPFLNVRIDVNGITVASAEPRTTNDNAASRSQADAKAINLYIERATATGQTWLAEASKYLTAEAETFTTWAGISASAPSPSTANENKKTFGLV